jgi:hypothetical protein
MPLSRAGAAVLIVGSLASSRRYRISMMRHANLEAPPDAEDRVVIAVTEKGVVALLSVLLQWSLIIASIWLARAESKLISLGRQIIRV